jgi:hypothetical protein
VFSLVHILSAGDHLHTNMAHFYSTLRNRNIYSDSLATVNLNFMFTLFPISIFQPLSCLNSSVVAQYAAVLFIDCEDEFSPTEITHIWDSHLNSATSIVILADWYNASVMRAIGFHDDNTEFV